MSNKICKCGHSEDKHQAIHQYDNDLACFHRVGNEGDEIWYCPCMAFEEDVVVNMQNDLKAVESNYDALQSPMPCGHLARYAVNGEGGTQYCCMCLATEIQKENGVLRRYIAKLEDEIDEQ